MRLVGGQSACEGRVEVCLSQRWGTVSSDGWIIENAEVVCRWLGYKEMGTPYVDIFIYIFTVTALTFILIIFNTLL